MFLEVHSALRLESLDQRVDAGNSLVSIVEEEDQLGAFLIHHFLGASLKSKRKVIFVGLEQSLGHYQAVAVKNGVNLHKARDEGQLVFLEGVKSYADAYLHQNVRVGFDFVARPRERDVMRTLFKQIEKEVSDGATVIVDKLSVLLSVCVPADSVIVFARYLHSLAARARCDVVILSRRDPDEVDGPLNRLASSLSRSSDLAIRCWPLSSGKSGSVTGNLSFEYSDGGCDVGRFQFGVEDKTVRVFALGASRDVL